MADLRAGIGENGPNVTSPSRVFRVGVVPAVILVLIVESEAIGGVPAATRADAG